MVTVTKLRINFGPENSVKTFQSFPDGKIIEKPIGEDVTNTSNLSKKRGPNELEEVQAKKKLKLDRGLSTQCFAVLRSLREHKFGFAFNEPVDPDKLNIPDYFSIITKPMDLGTIKSKLLKNAYSSPDEFAEDVRLTFNNAMLYNPPENWVHNVAKELKEIFEVRWESHKKKKVLDLSAIKVREASDRKLSEVDCSVELPKTVKEKTEKASHLLKPVKLQSKKDTPVVTPKALPTKLRIKNLDQGLGSGLTVRIPSKGSAPTEACKCSSCGRITCICLKSCNSSGSEVSSLTDCQVMNTSSSHASESELLSNGSTSSKNDKIGCVSSQLDTPLDNELKRKLPVLPPLPPEKALRAAILKGQFAETILRAKHRKVLGQSNKADLIRIQIEKEQMERTQREEKARIEAEMREAKIASRMRAVAELKEQRERERLERKQMELTFDFEENNYLKLEADLVDLCGSSNLTRSRLFKELGLYLKDDDCEEETDLKISNPMRVDDLEEGEIL